MPHWIIKNMTGDPLPLHGVSLDPGQQLRVIEGLTPEMVDAKNRGLLEIEPGDPTFEERREMAKIFADDVKKMNKITGEGAKPAPPKPATPPPPPPRPVEALKPPAPTSGGTPGAPPAKGPDNPNPGLVGSKDLPK